MRLFKTRWSSAIVPAAILLCGLLISVRVEAGVAYFNTASGDFATSSNWAGGAVPGSTVEGFIGSTSGGLLSASATYSTSTGFSPAGLDIGLGAGAVGSLTLSGSAGTISMGFISGASFEVGATSGTGSLFVNAGTITYATDLIVATGGTNTLGTVTVGGGGISLTSTGRLIIADASGGTATVNLNSGSISDASTVFAGGTGNSASETGTFNLNGGTLTTGFVWKSSSLGTYAFNFNGGTMVPTADQANFLQAGNTYNVQGNGAIFNTAGHSITISQALVASASNGGLTKTGSGSLTLTANSSGSPMNLTVNSGTLNLNVGGLAFSNTGGVGNGGTITVGSGSTLVLANLYNVGCTQPLVISGGTVNITAGSSSDGNNYTENVQFTAGGTIVGNPMRMGDSVASGGTVSVSGTVPATIQAKIDMIGSAGKVATFNVGSTGAGGADLTVSGIIQDLSVGGLPLTKTGVGTMLLTASSTWTGATNITAGTLEVGNGGSGASIGTTSGVALSNSANLTFNHADSINFAKVISGTGSVTQTGTGNLTFSVANTYNGGTAVNSGTLSLGVASALPSSGTVTINNGGTINVATGGDSAYSSVPATAIYSGGLLTASSGASLLQNLTLSGGTVAGSNPDTFGTWGFNQSGVVQPVHVTGGVTSTISALKIDSAWGNALTFNVDAGSTLNVPGTIGGNSGHSAFGVTLTGSGLVNFSNVNAYTGLTTIGGGTLQFSGGGLAGGSNLYVGSGTGSVASMVMNGSVGLVNFTGGSFPNGVYIGRDGATGTLTVSAGTLSSNGTAGDIVLASTDGGAGNSGSTGTLIVNGGVVTAGRLIFPDAPGGNGTVNLNSGSITLGGSLIYGGGSVSGTSSGSFNLNGGTLTTPVVFRNSGTGTPTFAFNFNGGTIVPSGSSSNFLQANVSYNVQGGGAIFNTAGFAITASQALVHSGTGSDGGLTKNGPGNLTLSASNNFNGNVLVSSGTLTSTISSGLGANTLGRSVTIAPGTTLNTTVSDAADYLSNVTNNVAFLVQGAWNNNPANTASTGFQRIDNLTVQGATINDYGQNAGGFGGILLSGSVMVSGSASSNYNQLGGGSGLALSSSTTFNVASTGGTAADFTVNGVIRNNTALGYVGALTKTGVGVMLINGANTYTGGTTVNNGTLQLGNTAALGTGSLAANGGALDLNGFTVTAPSFSGAVGVVTDSSTSGITQFYVNQTASTTFGGSFQTGPNGRQVSLNQQGPGMLNLTGANTVAGAKVQNTATLVVNGPLNVENFSFSGGAKLAGSGAVVLTTGADGLDYASSAASTFGGNISGPNTAGVDVDNGSLTLTGSNTYAGPTTVTGGLLTAGAHGAISTTSAVVISDGTLDASGFAQTIQSLSMTGGLLNLSIGNLLMSNGTAGFGGTLNILGTPTGTIDELMSYTGHLGSFTLATSFAGYTLTYNTNELDLVQNPTGPATWNVASGGSWTDASKWSGGTVPSGSGAQAVVGAATNAQLTITLDNPQTLGRLTFANSSNAFGYTLSAGSAGSLTLDNSTSAAQIIVTGGSHGIASSVAITLNSSLVVTPTAGSTLVIDGNISENPALSGKTLTLADAGTLILGGTNSFTGGTTVSNGTLILTNNEAVADGSSLTVGDASAFAPVVPATAVAAGSGSNATAITAVPEPGTLLLLTGGLVMLAMYRKRRQK